MVTDVCRFIVPDLGYIQVEGPTVQVGPGNHHHL